MNVLSLFDGISGLRVALDRANIKINNYYASEIDKYAIKISQSNYSDIIQLGDVNSWEEWQLPKIDLLVAGFPCQAFSVAGNQKAFDDPRGALALVLCDVFNHIKQINPNLIFLFENVRMSNANLSKLDQLFQVEHIKINSALVSAQNRLRCYWTNIPGIEQPTDKGILLKDILESGEVDRDKAYCIDANYYKGASLETYLKKKRRQLVFEGGKTRKLSPMECERLQTFSDGYTNHVSNTQRYKALGNSFTVDIIAHILSYLHKDDKRLN